MLRYAVVGSGAVGCFYGIRLAHAGADVQFLMRSGAEDVRATTDALMADPDSVALIRTLMTEVAAASAAEGRALPEALIDDLLATTARMAPYATSMKLDADAGRPMEVEAMLAEPLRRAERAGVTMPSVGVLHHQLAFLDRRTSRSR